MKRALFTVASLLPAPVLAQPVPDPYPQSGEMPTILEPGGTGTQGARPPEARTPAQPAPQPNVIVVGPDGKVTTQAPAPAESGYYVSGGAGTPYSEPAEIHAGALPELHVVRSGDTLWDICFYYFNNPWQWPKVWSYNPQITNPHWIYPGDLVRLLPRGMFSSAQAAPIAGPPEPESAPVDRRLPSPARRLEVGVRQTAFVEKDDLDRVDHDRWLGRREGAARRRRLGLPELSAGQAAEGRAALLDLRPGHAGQARRQGVRRVRARSSARSRWSASSRTSARGA